MISHLLLRWRTMLLLLILLSSQSIIIDAKIEQEDERSVTLPKRKVVKPLLDPIPMLPQVTHKVFLDVEIEDGDDSGGRIELGLFGTHAPQLVENFRALCACDQGNGKRTKKPLCYKGSTFHRIITNFMIQGGDFTHHDGTGGETIFGADIVDESFAVKHNRKFLLSSANKGRRNSNASQFFITTVKAQWLDDHHVVFGFVLSGEDVVQAIERQGTNGGKPRQKITVVNSGVLELTAQEKLPIPVAQKIIA
mmetsp:Transcript_15638/g.26150  ORF Transcript_15638/g.26150 Transcript_15638/m.26150 type:complete len:251 (+) Transcript_15638:811-1563(+)|eukprot:CAMPEP_0119007978 /NCGR_PEP_ID=MMETSP1176-20130426/3375_1 /TAXON_ID=265551 /ORGANISM="Synedropsis recta cf, Strain CCMP1620" /LENGTH=250 /DNA_ID=CAMNT_0006960223 /DNA_START=99 /DNA_END=851 /DNA_ORIENTATION=-